MINVKNYLIVRFTIFTFSNIIPPKKNYCSYLPPLNTRELPPKCYEQQKMKVGYLEQVYEVINNDVWKCVLQ